MSHKASPIVRRILTLASTAISIARCVPGFAAAGERVGDVEVNVQPLPSKDNRSGTAFGTRHGFVEFRVQLKNPSTEERIVHLSYPATHDKWVTYGVVTTRTVAIAGGQAVSVSLYQPPLDVANAALEVRVEGVHDPKQIPVASLHDGWFDPTHADRIAVLLSRSVPQDFREREIAKSGPKATVRMPRGPALPPRLPGMAPPPTTIADRFAFLRSELSVGQWSDNWLGYSCYDVIVLSGTDVEEMPPPVQLAVRRYLECGGTLLIHARDVPAAFSQGGFPDGKGGCFVGLGHAVAGLDGGQADWNATYKKLTTTPLHAYQPVEKPRNLYDLLVAEATVPVRGLFVLVLLFGVGIGPANLWLLSRYKRRIWLWWNVPAISLLTCLVVFGYSLASEGLAGHGKTASLTLLDERVHRATTIGYLSYYCPLTPSVGPRFGVDTDVTLLENTVEPWRRYAPRGPLGNLRLEDWTSDQYLVSGWVNARVPAYFQIRKNEDRRERLSVEKKADGSLKIVNALGADIQRLYLADASGHVFEGRDIPAGAERTLTAVADRGLALGAVRVPPRGRVTNPDALQTAIAKGSPQARLRGIFSSSDWLGEFRDWRENLTPAHRPFPGCYLAYLGKSPFVESPLAGVESEDSVAIVYGIMKERDK